jgi:ankyrin repeat protein
MISVHLFIIILFLFHFYKDGNTALIYASCEGHFEIVKLLIANNADMNIQHKVFLYLYIIILNVLFILLLCFFYFKYCNL